MPDFNIKEIESLKFKIQVIDRTSTFGLVAGIVCLYMGWNWVISLLFVALIIIQIVKSRYKKQLKQKEYLAKIVEERTIELRVQRDQVLKESEELSQALNALGDAQDELVRNERLATVGQLTKGLLDRILNPLNYINNFATLSVELVADLKKNISGEGAVMTPELYADSVEILEMITSNLQKITDHGANTVRIVKAMEELLKDRSGKMTSADINNLCKVNMGVAARMFEKEIAAKGIKLRFDGLSLPLMIDVNIEQMNKMLLHLYQNSIYALLRKAEKQAYEPEMSVALHKKADTVQIIIHDNGIGIEDSIKKRIFEPFFTTKPTSEGSGIGLYLSHEIILNHKGTINVTSEKDIFTEFTITVPIHQPVEVKYHGERDER